MGQSRSRYTAQRRTSALNPTLLQNISSSHIAKIPDSAVSRSPATTYGIPNVCSPLMTAGSKGGNSAPSQVEPLSTMLWRGLYPYVATATYHWASRCIHGVVSDENETEPRCCQSVSSPRTARPARKTAYLFTARAKDVRVAMLTGAAAASTVGSVPRNCPIHVMCNQTLGLGSFREANSNSIDGWNRLFEGTCGLDLSWMGAQYVRPFPQRS